MHAAQERARLEAELLDEQLPALAIDLERLRLPTGAVEREHQLRPEPLPERMLANERLELRDEVGVSADRELRLGAFLEQCEVELLEARDLLLGERLVAELGERLAAPEGECLVEQLRPPRGLVRPGLVDEPPHPGYVQLLRLEAHEIARRPRLDHVRPERLPQLGDEVLQRRRGGRGRCPVPERIEEPVERDDAPGLEQERRQQRALLRAAESDRLAVCTSFERAEDGEVDQCRRVVPPWQADLAP